MPIYAFACAACGHTFERLQKLSDADPVDCPSCAAATVRRQLTAPQFRLSGSGWYETDFKKEGETRRNLVDKSEVAASSATSSDSKSEAKPTSPAAAPEAKSESKPASSSNDAV